MSKLSISQFLLLVFLGELLAGTSAQAQTVIATNPGVSVLGYGTYDFSAVSDTYASNPTLFQSQPWWGSASVAQTFASTAGNFGSQPYFIYSANKRGEFFAYTWWGNDSDSINSTFTWGIAIATPTSAPEIDGALIPQVGLLLAGLLLIFRRRK